MWEMAVQIFLDKIIFQILPKNYCFPESHVSGLAFNANTSAPSSTYLCIFLQIEFIKLKLFIQRKLHEVLQKLFFAENCSSYSKLKLFKQ